MADANRHSVIVSGDKVSIDTYVDGEGPAFVILPSYGRDGGADYDAFVARLGEACWKVLRPQPRGVGRSTGPMTGVSLHDLADDVALCIRQLADGPTVIVGHAFGNAVARMTATDHPELVQAVVLAGAQAAKVAPEIAEAPFIAGDLAAPEADRLAVLRRAFFAPGHDARAWLDGWYPATFKMQREAAAAVSPSDFWAGGKAPLLELIGACDPFKPQAYWNELRDQLGERVTTRIVPDASHALFPEQPDVVADEVLWAAHHASSLT